MEVLVAGFGGSIAAPIAVKVGDMAINKFGNVKTNNGNLSNKEVLNEDSSEKYYRTMSESDYESLVKNGKISATGETFISPTESYSKKFNGIRVEFEVKSGTTNSLEGIGVKANTPFTNRKYYNMPNVEGGWNNNNAYFKYEDLQVNIGLGKGKALDIFNNNIINFRKLGGK